MVRSHQHWIEELGYSIEEWSRTEESLIEVLGRVHLMEMAASAFFAATSRLGTRLRRFAGFVLAP